MRMLLPAWDGEGGGGGGGGGNYNTRKSIKLCILSYKQSTQ